MIIERIDKENVLLTDDNVIIKDIITVIFLRYSRYVFVQDNEDFNLYNRRIFRFTLSLISNCFIIH